MTTTKTRTRPSEPDSRILIVEPATEGGVRNVDYWDAIEADPLMIVIVESIDEIVDDSEVEPMVEEIIARVRLGELMSSSFAFTSLERALEFADPSSWYVIYARRLDDPKFGEGSDG